VKKRSVLIVGLTATLLMSACGANDSGGGDEESTDVTTTTTAPAGDAKVMFGDLDSPCGKDIDGTTVTVKADQAGGSPDALRIGIANERASTIRPGLLQEMYDAGTAFVQWCNAQGGIGGLPLEAVDLDGKLLQVEQAMATACTGTFALVGGGWVQDNLMYSGKDGSDFHKCKLIAFPGFAVSTDVAEGNGILQPIPNPAYIKPSNWIVQLVKLFPEEMKKTTVVWGNIPSLKANKDQIYGVGKTVAGFGAVDGVSYDGIGQPDWSLVAQQVKDTGATAVSFVGEPQNLSKLSQALKAQDYTGPIFADANQYDQILIDTSGPEAVEGVITRQAFHPFEEADKWPGIEAFDKMMETYNPTGKVAALSLQATSALLLFATAARDCAKGSGGEISRDCVMKAGFAIKDWTAGGLHAATQPSSKKPGECALLLQVQGGKYVRLDPELDDPDAVDGFFCSPIAEITGDLGTGNIDPTRAY